MTALYGECASYSGDELLRRKRLWDGFQICTEAMNGHAISKTGGVFAHHPLHLRIATFTKLSNKKIPDGTHIQSGYIKYYFL